MKLLMFMTSAPDLAGSPTAAVVAACENSCTSHVLFVRLKESKAVAVSAKLDIVRTQKLTTVDLLDARRLRVDTTGVRKEHLRPTAMLRATNKAIATE
jgi:hypothetical protein